MPANTEQGTMTYDRWSSRITEEHVKTSGFRREDLAELAYIYFRRMDDRYGRRIAEPRAVDVVAELAGFFRERAPGEIKVRLIPAKDLAEDAAEGAVALETVMADQRFIVDTIKLCIADFHLREQASVNILVPVRRDAAGKALSVQRVEAPDHPYDSLTRFLVSGLADAAQQERLVAEVQARLRIAHGSVRDYLRFKRTMRDLANAWDFLAHSGHKQGPHDAELAEGKQVLDWILDDHFLYMDVRSLGLEENRLVFRKGECLGSCFDGITENDPFLGEARAFLTAPPRGNPVFQLRKSQVESRMHRAGLLEMVMLRRFDDQGRPDGGFLLFGLFTRKAQAALRAEVPFLKRRLARLMEQDEIRPESYLYKARMYAFNAIPLEYLFEARDEELSRVIHRSLDAEFRMEAAAHLDLMPDRASAYALIAVPREAYSEALVERVKGRLADTLGAGYVEVQSEAAKGQVVPLSLYLERCSRIRSAVREELEQEVIHLCTPWRQRFRKALTEGAGKQSKRLYAQYAEAFPEAYQQATSVEDAIADVKHLEKFRATSQIQFDILGANGATTEARLRLYRPGQLLLSDILPILHNVGFRVLDQAPTEVRLADGTTLRIDTFRLKTDKASGEAEYVESRDRLVAGLTAVFDGKMRSDPLNRLMLKPGLGWEDVDLLRAYVRYSMQIGPFFATSVVERVLFHHASLTGALVEYFHTRFHPRLGAADSDERKTRVEIARRAIVDGLRAIQDASEDRVFRVLLNLIDATVRTNAFRTDRKFHYISFKIDCAKLDKCPEPRPLYEISVYHAEMEGCHLRGGKVARGGIRWSDRPDDFRTEIFGLMRTQQVKNVLIVPVGAKGGFVVRGVPKAGQDRKAYGDAMYEVLIRGMLDVTDNRVEGKEVRPVGVVCHDAFDPYLVVAADKGTAHLSDTANRLSAEYHHWLDDAFASGGSAGYDHKVEGITAKGAWACARHNFGKLGIDPEKDVIRVVGIGDLSGDVFGNGMLRSRTMKVVGAFNHMHVFLDPDPDPEASFRERDRMFKLPRSSWTDYDAKVISKGGGIFLRSEKAIKLTPEVQALLGTGAAELAGDEVIRALLTLDVDLLYNGGIGTYVKASTEDHREVGDKTNDAVRVDAKDVRARVVGEGGNLGLTQRARIEYALKGGLVNSDAVDNSGGVDLSDHEVNLKILFTPLVAEKKLTIGDRNKLMREICPEVCQKVVEDNEAHALLLTLDEVRSQSDPYLFLRTVEFLAEKGVMDAAREDLPTLADLQERGLTKGLTRPELGKLMAFAKMWVFGELVKMDVKRFPRQEHLLGSYFPKQVFEGHRDAIGRHMLLRELLATVWTNHLTMFTGATMFPDLASDCERGVADVATAYAAVDGWLGAIDLRGRILACDAPAPARYRAVVMLEDGIKVAASWLLHFLVGEALQERVGDAQDFTKTGAPFRASMEVVKRLLPSIGVFAKRRVDANEAVLVKAGVPSDLAHEVAWASQYSKAFPVTELAMRTKRPVEDVARSYLYVGQHTGLADLLIRMSMQASTDRWEAQALRSLRASLRRTMLLLTEKSVLAGPEVTLARDTAFAHCAADVHRLHANPNDPVPVSMLVVIGERLHKAVMRL